jgi:hypothetical protein
MAGERLANEGNLIAKAVERLANEGNPIAMAAERLAVEEIRVRRR